MRADIKVLRWPFVGDQLEPFNVSLPLDETGFAIVIRSAGQELM
jgi:hypothetical protein